jgi:hypothetical protein
MEAAARKAARGLVRDFGEVEQLQVSKKGPADFVSAADLRAERMLRTELTKARPRYGFLLEEQGEVKGVDEHNRWVVDPLDGTTNFLHGIPHFAISIAHERDGEVIAGVIYEPIRDEMFWAEKGAGAYLNDRRLRVSARTDLADSARRRSISPMSRPAAMRASGSSGCRAGTSRRACSWCAKPAASSPISRAATPMRSIPATCSPPTDSSTRRSAPPSAPRSIEPCRAACALQGGCRARKPYVIVPNFRCAATTRPPATSRAGTIHDPSRPRLRPDSGRRHRRRRAGRAGRAVLAALANLPAPERSVQ